MNTCTYLNRLSDALAQGLVRLPERFRRKQQRYVESLQTADGGFRGRSAASDLYYTSFALRTLDTLDAGKSPAWPAAAAYVQDAMRNAAAGDAIDCFCLLHTKRMIERRGVSIWSAGEAAACDAHCQQTLARFASNEGGWARQPGGQASLYHTFLAALCMQMLGQRAGEWLDVVHSRQRDDGGFSDLGKSARGETSPTAAAVGLLQMAGALGELRRPAAEFLLAMQRPDGGFAAHADAPVPDLLSTFTALVSLAALGEAARARLADAGRFVQQLQARGGGFRGALLHDEPDAEYTYYGLGTIGLLAASAKRCRL